MRGKKGVYSRGEKESLFMRGKGGFAHEEKNVVEQFLARETFDFVKFRCYQISKT